MSTALVLASGSATRLEMLHRAGVPVSADPAAVDEDTVKHALQADGASAQDAAEALAEMKAQRISGRCPGVLVLGADQMLHCDGVWYDKPGDRTQAARQLSRLRGRTHELISAAVVVLDGARQWHHVARARLTMRPFSDDFLADYLETVGDACRNSVGGYQIEGPGAQLFSRIDGDFFTVLGLPLLPVLEFLRARGVLAS